MKSDEAPSDEEVKTSNFDAKNSNFQLFPNSIFFWKYKAMPTAILLNPDDPIFSFEHAMAHRRYFAVMSPLDRFSALPYLLDPPYDTNVRASMWHLHHQKSHSDFAASLPSNYNAPPTEVGLPLRQPLMDSDLANAESRTWWSFAQHREHFLADQAILPLQSGVWPFW